MMSILVRIGQRQGRVLFQVLAADASHLQEIDMTDSHDAGPAWHDLIKYGNAHFVAGRYLDARSAYDRALVMVDRLVGVCPVDIALLISKIVTHQNRANTLARLGQLEEADAEFQQGHAFARAIAEEVLFPGNLRQAARCHSRMVSTEWQVFRSEYGYHPDHEAGMLAAVRVAERTPSPQVRTTVH